MARNRKHGSASVRFGPALKICLGCLLVSAAGLGYVAQKNQLYLLGSQYKELEVRGDRLRRENSVRARVLDTLQSPAELDARIKQMNLGLIAPQPDQIIRLVESPRFEPKPAPPSAEAEAVFTMHQRRP